MCGGVTLGLAGSPIPGGNITVNALSVTKRNNTITTV